MGGGFRDLLDAETTAWLDNYTPALCPIGQQPWHKIENVVTGEKYGTGAPTADMLGDLPPAWWRIRDVNDVIVHEINRPAGL